MAIIILIAMFNFKSCQNSENCADYKHFANAKYSGTVLRKIKDKNNHNVRTVILKSGQVIILSMDTSAFFSIVQPGDFVVKRAGTRFVEVKGRKENYRFNISFGSCKSQ